MPKKVLDSIFSDAEKHAIRAFIENKVQLEAVKKALLIEPYYNGTLKAGEEANPRRNAFMGVAMTMDDPTKIGLRSMSMAEAINYIELGFQKLAEYGREEKVVEKGENPAR